MVVHSERDVQRTLDEVARLKAQVEGGGADLTRAGRDIMEGIDAVVHFAIGHQLAIGPIVRETREWSNLTLMSLNARPGSPEAARHEFWRAFTDWSADRFTRGWR